MTTTLKKQFKTVVFFDNLGDARVGESELRLAGYKTELDVEVYDTSLMTAAVTITKTVPAETDFDGDFDALCNQASALANELGGITTDCWLDIGETPTQVMH